MNGQNLYNIWAPSRSAWSQWAKPVMFAEIKNVPFVPRDGEWPTIQVQYDSGTAIIFDLPGTQSVEAGIAVALRGYRPVPLFNSAMGTSGIQFAYFYGTVKTEGILRMLIAGAAKLLETTISDDAAPAFLLDSSRFGSGFAAPGEFDNRWVVFPQDFPSANFLKSKGIRRVLLYRPVGIQQPMSDLSHVLLRWQEQDIQLFLCTYGVEKQPEPLKVTKPSNFKMLWQRALAWIAAEQRGWFWKHCPGSVDDRRRLGCFGGNYSSNARHMYHAAVVRKGRHFSPCSSKAFGVGRSFSL